MAFPPCLNQGKHEELLYKPRSELFEIIECAITIAALHWPKQLQAEKDRLLKGFNMCRASEAKETPMKATTQIKYGGLVQENENAVKNPRRIIDVKVDLLNRDRKSTSKVTTTKTTALVNPGDLHQKEDAAAESSRRIIHVKVDLPDRDCKSPSNPAKPALQKAASCTTAAAKRMPETKRDDEAKGDYEKKLEIAKRKLQSGYTACDESRKRSRVIDFWTEVPKNTQQQIICDKNVSAGRFDNKKARSSSGSSQQQLGRRRQLVPPEIQRFRPPLLC